jgi:hypothetical protein
VLIFVPFLAQAADMTIKCDYWFVQLIMEVLRAGHTLSQALKGKDVAESPHIVTCVHVKMNSVESNPALYR